MTDEAPETKKPGPSRKAIIGWTVGMLAVLGLAWFIGAVVVPVWRVRVAVEALSCGQQYADDSKCREAIQELGGPDRAVVQLDRYLQLPRILAPHKWAACWLLGYCGKPAVPVLMRGHGQRYGIITTSLGRIGADAADAIPRLVEDFETLEGSLACQHAALALGRIGKREAVEPLVSALMEGRPTKTPRVGPDEVWTSKYDAALFGVRVVENPEAVELLSRLVADRRAYSVGWEATAAAAEALGGIGDPRAVPSLLEAFKFRARPSRQAVITALGKIGDERALEPLKTAFEKKDDVGLFPAYREALRNIEAAQEKDK